MDNETSIVSESTTSKGKKTANGTWSHTRHHFPNEPERHKNHVLLYCKHCPLDSTYASEITTNFRTHLRTKHGIVVEKQQNAISQTSLEDFDQLYNKLSQAGQMQEFTAKVLEKTLDRRMVNEVLVSLVVVWNLPFSIVEWPEFHIFCCTVNPQIADYLTTSHNIIASLIDKSWQLYQDFV